MGLTKISIMIVLIRIADKGGKHYVTPKPKTLLKLLKQYQGVVISRRWLFQCLKDLEEMGLITRRRRYSPRSSTYQFRQLPGILAFTYQGCEFLACRGVAGATKIKKLITDWIKRKDQRFPRLDQPPQSQPIRKESGANAIGDILSGIVPGG